MHILLAFLLTKPSLAELTKTNPPLVSGSQCAANNGDSSLQVDGDIGRAYAKRNPNGSYGPWHMETVADANVVYFYASTRRFSDDMVVYNQHPVGWIYRDNLGQYWFQRTSVRDWNLSVYGKPLGRRFQEMFGIMPPAGKIPVSLTGLPKTVDPYFFSLPCFRGGQAFFGVKNGLPRP